MEWAGLFDRAAEYETTTAAVADALAERRAGGDSATADADETGAASAAPASDESPDSGPARIVADADVLAADVLVGGPAREAMDLIHRHDWVTLVASDALVSDAEAVIADLTDADLAADWRTLVDCEREAVDHPAGDHPALASALHGGAMHVLTLDESLQSARAGTAIRGHVETSLKDPRAFVRLFDPERLYPVVAGADGDAEYSGPDREPRA